MSRKNPTTRVLKRVFAFSGNQCAYTDCQDSLFEKDLFVGELAHICAANAGGPRFNNTLSDDELRAQNNLMLLCHRHHRLIDAFPEKYPVSILESMKTRHEKQFEKTPFILDNEKIISAQKVIDAYWESLVIIGLQQDQSHDLAKIVDKNSDEAQLISTIQDSLDRSVSVIRDTDRILSDLDETVLPFLQKNAFVPDEKCPITMFDLGYGFNRIDWEMRNIGGENFYGSASFALLQLQVKIAEYKVLLSPDDSNAHDNLKGAREQLTIAAEQASYVD